MGARAPHVSVLALCAAAAVLLARASGASAVYEDPTRPAIGIAGPPDDYCTLQVHGPTCWGTDLSCVPPSPTAFTNIACQHTYIDDLTVGTLNGRQLCDCDSSCDCGGGGTGGDGSVQVLSGPCHPGYASVSGNASDCTACSPSRWSDGTTAYCPWCIGSCMSCSPTTGICSRCINGMKLSFDRTVCEDCVPGQYSTNGVECFYCPPGTTSNIVQAADCAPCSAGTYSEGFGNTNCATCPAGTFNPYTGLAEANACQECPTGSSGNGNPGQPRCVQCIPGSYSSEPGRVDGCAVCPIRTYVDYPGAAHCHACDDMCTNTCNPTSGACTCPTGYFRVGTSCVACPRGSWSAEGSITCTLCADDDPCPNCGQGYFYDFDSGVCEPCPFGEWSDGTAINVCNRCNQNCDVCDPGTGICLHCADNHAHVEGNSRECVVCPGNDCSRRDASRSTVN